MTDHPRATPRRPILGRAGRASAAGAAGLLALALAACTPGAGNDAGGGDASPAVDVNTDVASLGEVELTVWDQEVRGGQADQLEELNQAFEEAYPNVTINRVSRSTDDLRTTLRLALSGNEAPDVVQVSNGRPDMGSYVEAGLLRNLDPYAEAYGWAERFDASVLANASYTDDGATLGDGSVYGAAQMGEMVGVYYNRELLAELDLEAPTTWEEFDAAVVAAEEAGELPIQFGNLDQWPGIHMLGAAQSRYVDPETIRDLGYGRPGSSWATPENTQAAQALVDWAEDGYLTPDFNGVGSDPAWQAFGEGEGVFLIGGTWLLADLTDALGDSLGFTAFPGADGQTVVATGGTSLPFAIPQRSENADAAAAYIDFITSTDAMAVISEHGNLPVADVAAQEAEGAQREVFDTYDRLVSGGGMVPYLDYATPDSYDVITQQVQSLMGGEATPEEFLDALETEYQENVAQ
ncbi:ABC transporter substrate-binding protein [Allonocardiopsis opalescens]|uniref:Carbohydrate ABC transporter substrate-binding protein (CUT1 family) n=1 Tax=Allonocardiopsis opalescens TaxID=1144618 RepID=A0A2T0Q7D4_9ACTN|nr:extracellular solute-binding protein [Allonocardiopsis opalescens]PRX99633.1 carbohydrate ABC transporter substrate-binding protein (CUT1 family) [Allonocardiopsis opalescens]